jgi:hypothetical protein
MPFLSRFKGQGEQLHRVVVDVREKAIKVMGRRAQR